jgi:hypothetical protein
MSKLKTIHMLVAEIIRDKGWPKCEPPARFIAQDVSGNVYAYCGEIEFEENSQGGSWTSADNNPCLPDTGNWSLGNYPLAVDYKSVYVTNALETNDVDSW